MDISQRGCWRGRRCQRGARGAGWPEAAASTRVRLSHGVELATLRHGTIEFRRDDALPLDERRHAAAELRWESAARWPGPPMLPDGRRAWCAPGSTCTRSRAVRRVVSPAATADEDAEPGPLVPLRRGRLGATATLRARAAERARRRRHCRNLIAMLARAAAWPAPVRWTVSDRGCTPRPRGFATAGGATDDDQLRFSDGVAPPSLRMDEVDVDFSPALLRACLARAGRRGGSQPAP